jgi:hypothetical protein
MSPRLRSLALACTLLLIGACETPAPLPLEDKLAAQRAKEAEDAKRLAAQQAVDAGPPPVEAPVTVRLAAPKKSLGGLERCAAFDSILVGANGRHTAICGRLVVQEGASLGDYRVATVDERGVVLVSGAQTVNFRFSRGAAEVWKKKP